MIRYTYADLLFSTAKSQESIDHINEQFEVMMTLVDDNPDWITVLDTPVLSNKSKYEVLRQIKLFDATFLAFLEVLIRNRHVRLIHDIYNEWLIRSRQDQKVAFIQLYSPTKLDPERLTALKKEIQPLIPDMQIEFNIHIDTSLISGIRLYYQGRSLERSMRRELIDMKNSI